MKTALSSAAAPKATLQDLLEGCARRGLDGVHLIDGHDHGWSLDSSESDILRILLEVQSRELIVTSIATASLRAVTPERAAEVSRMMGAPLVVQEGRASDWTVGYERAGGLLATGVTLNAVQGNVLDAARAWFDGDLPQHITLQGGGPEASLYEGRGIGSLMSRLSLAGYQGTLTLAPTARAVLPVWNAWLNHGRSWGCGSHKSDASLVNIG